MGRAAVKRLTSAVSSWWLQPQRLARVAVLRTIVYLFVVADVLAVTALVVPQSESSALYQPVDVLQLIHQPAPEPWFTKALRIVIVVAAAIAATGKLRRTAGVVVAVAYADWCCLAMSYGKVDHDHLAILVAVVVLPTVSGASWRATTDSESAGWALRCIAVAVVATYFLSAYAKMRFGGSHWALGATFTWAVLRRGTALGRPLLHHPTVLLGAQWGLWLLEASTPALLFLRQRWRTLFVIGLGFFHLTTWLAIRIHFLPLVVCLPVFLPLEQVAALAVRREHQPRPLAVPTYAE
jgi:hypothetical protein